MNGGFETRGGGAQGGGHHGAAHAPVDDVALVHVVKPVQYLLDDALDARRRERDLGVDQPRQVVVHVLHHQVDVAHPHAHATPAASDHGPASRARGAGVPGALPTVATSLLLRLRAGGVAHRRARLEATALVVHILDLIHGWMMEWGGASMMVGQIIDEAAPCHHHQALVQNQTNQPSTATPLSPSYRVHLEVTTSMSLTML